MPRTIRPLRRRGIAVVIVLALLTMTLALSYSMMRVQATTSQIQNNFDRQADARQAAMSGIAAGIRKMHQDDWEGAGSYFDMDLGDNQWFEVRYVQGDSELSSSDPDYHELPFRVTIVATGFAADPTNSQVFSQYTIRSVMQLVRRKVQSPSSEWQATQSYNVYASGTGHSYLEGSAKIQGNLFVHGDLHLFEEWQTVNKPFKGLIDELAIYDRKLSALEILKIKLFGNGSNSVLNSTIYSSDLDLWLRFNDPVTATQASDSSGSNNHGVYAGGVIPGINVWSDNHAAYFDGVSGRVELGTYDLPSRDEFTILAWVLPMSLSGDNADSRIISKATGIEDSDHLFMLSTMPTGGGNAARVRLKTDSEMVVHSASSGLLSLNQWNLIVVTYEKNPDGPFSDPEQATLDIYKDGVLSSTITTSGSARLDSNMLTWIGDNPPGSARTRYFEDLKRLAEDNQGDYRPISGNVTISSDRSDLETYLAIYRSLGAVATYQSTSASRPTNINNAATQYQLYPNGPIYEIPEVDHTMRDVAHVADTETNPLGIFRTSSSTTFWENVSIEGTLLIQNSGSDLNVRGTNISIKGRDLPSVYGESSAFQLPVVMVADDIKVTADASAEFEGSVYAYDDFYLLSGDASPNFKIAGQLIVDTFSFQANSAWETLADYSGTHLINFMDSVGWSDASSNFAQWLHDNTDGDLERNVLVSAPSTAKTYQMVDLSQPIFQAGDEDTGLMWELVRWDDNGGQ